MSPVLDYDGMHTSCRVENIDGDNNWNFGDTNGNRAINKKEPVGAVVQIDDLQSPSTSAYYLSGTSRIPNTSLFQNRYSIALSINDTFVDNQPPNLITFGFPDSGVSDDIDSDGFQEISESHDSISDQERFHTGFLSSPESRDFSQLGDLSLLKVVRFSSNSESAKLSDSETIRQSDVRQEVKVSVGGRYLRLQDQVIYTGEAHTQVNWNLASGHMALEATVDDEMIGSEIGILWNVEKGRWSMQAGGTYFWGFSDAQSTQTGLITSKPSPIFEQFVLGEAETHLNYRRNDVGLSGIADLGITAKYRITPSTLIGVSYSALYFSELNNAVETVNWQFPNFGILDSPTQDAFTDTFYASISFRR